MRKKGYKNKMKRNKREEGKKAKQMMERRNKVV